MKNAILLHGSASSPKEFWFPSIRRHLENHGYSVWAPLLPQSRRPDVRVQLPFVLGHGTFNRTTILMGHTAGAPLILSVLENIQVKVAKAVLVAGFSSPLKGKKPPILQDCYDWAKIRDSAREFVFINSDDDPWGCDHHKGLEMFGKLGGTLIILHGQGHLGSTTFNQPYKKFKLLEQLVL